MVSAYVRNDLADIACYWLSGIYVSVRGKIKGVSVINAGYFSTYFEHLPENGTAALLWEGQEKLKGLGG